MGENKKMKRRFVVSLMIFGFFMYFSVANGGVEEDQSIGTAAGQTVRDMTDQTQKTAVAASAQTEQAAKQFTQIAGETLQQWSAQLQEGVKNLQESGQELMKRLNEEGEKFKQAYSKPAKP